VNKREAAEALGISERSVNRYVAKGELMVTYQRKKSGGQEAEFDSAEVERLRRKLSGETPTGMVRREPTPPARQPARGAVALTRVASVGASERDGAPATAEELRARPVLTFEEASRVTGLGPAGLRSVIEEHSLRVLPYGPHGARVVSTRALLAAIGEVFGA
jgi:transposase